MQTTARSYSDAPALQPVYISARARPAQLTSLFFSDDDGSHKTRCLTRRAKLNPIYTAKSRAAADTPIDSAPIYLLDSAANAYKSSLRNTYQHKFFPDPTVRQDKAFIEFNTFLLDSDDFDEDDLAREDWISQQPFLGRNLDRRRRERREREARRQRSTSIPRTKRVSTFEDSSSAEQREDEEHPGDRFPEQPSPEHFEVADLYAIWHYGEFLETMDTVQATVDGIKHAILTVQTTVQGIKMSAIFDTGSAFTLASLKFTSSLGFTPLQFKQPPRDLAIRSATGQVVRPLGLCT
jgi:hypothetical protein